jgi:hypothetical protein
MLLRLRPDPLLPRLVGCSPDLPLCLVLWRCLLPRLRLAPLLPVSSQLPCSSSPARSPGPYLWPTILHPRSATQGILFVPFVLLAILLHAARGIDNAFLAPYKGQRCHVSERQHHQPVGLKEVFNQTHLSLRNVIERSFEVLKIKWCILLYLSSYDVDKQAKIIVACMTLYNFIREHDLDDSNFELDVQDISHGGQHSVAIEGTTGDEIDMDALRDAITAAIVV